MTNFALRKRFPFIRERHQVLADLQARPELWEKFTGWGENRQQYFLDLCTGARGIKPLYDRFFKAVMNPDTVPERLETLLSLILDEQVKILKVLPSDSGGIAAEQSLLILDIVVELADRSIANVEVQRIGYAFPGQRSACYSADLLLRQYKHAKGELGRAFSYRNVKKVYTIVFFDKSGSEFHAFEDSWIHHMQQTSDTGIRIDLLQEYVFFALDIFRKNLQNKNVEDNELNAWLTFLSVDDPEIILQFLTAHPEFEPLYREVYEMCQDTENMMQFFSKELRQMDANTTEYMIDEMQDTIDEMKNTIGGLQSTIDGMQNTIDTQKERIAELEMLLAEKNK